MIADKRMTDFASGRCLLMIIKIIINYARLLHDHDRNHITNHASKLKPTTTEKTKIILTNCELTIQNPSHRKKKLSFYFLLKEEKRC